MNHGLKVAAVRGLDVEFSTWNFHILTFLELRIFSMSRQLIILQCSMKQFEWLCYVTVAYTEFQYDMLEIPRNPCSIVWDAELTAVQQDIYNAIHSFVYAFFNIIQFTYFGKPFLILCTEPLHEFAGVTSDQITQTILIPPKLVEWTGYETSQTTKRDYNAALFHVVCRVTVMIFCCWCDCSLGHLPFAHLHLKTFCNLCRVNVIFQ